MPGNASLDHLIGRRAIFCSAPEAGPVNILPKQAADRDIVSLLLFE